MRTRGTPRISPPLFPPNVWSVYDNNLNGFPRTQNKVEAWHRRWNALVGRPHIGVFGMINEVLKEQNRSEIEITKYINFVNTSNPLRNKEINEEKSLQNIINSRNSRTLDEYLKAIAHRYAFNI